MGTIEHRKLFRAEITIKASYADTQGLGIKGIFQTVDISSIGMQVIGADKLETDTELDIKFFIPKHKDPLRGMYRVMWQKECLYQPQEGKAYYVTGLVLKDMTPEHAIWASDFIFDVAKEHQMENEKKIINQFEGR